MQRHPQSPASRRPLLWLSVTHPGERHAGNQVYSGGLLDALGALGQPVTLLTRDDGPAIAGVHVIAVPPPRLRPRAFGLASAWPASVWQLAAPRLRARFRSLLASTEWRAVVVDQAASGWALLDLARAAPRLVYIAHNQEGAVRRQVAAREPSPLKRAVMRHDAAKYARLEQALIGRAGLVTAITPADAAAFAASAGAPPVLDLTPGYSGPSLTRHSLTPATPRRLILVGRFEWQAKQQNLRRWAAEAVPLLAAAGIETQVVGTVPEPLRRELQRPGLTFAGRVAALAPYLQDARFGLVAEEVGGGFKLKTLDYIFHRLPVAALADNLAGQPEGVIANTLLAETPAALAQAIAATIDDLERLCQMQDNAYQAAFAAFDWSERARRFLAALDHLDCRN